MSEIRFFADHCVSNFIINALKDIGYVILKLRDLIPHNSPDKFVIEKAQELNTILITLNGDFADILSYPPANFQALSHCKLEIIPKPLPI